MEPATATPASTVAVDPPAPGGTTLRVAGELLHLGRYGAAAVVYAASATTASGVTRAQALTGLAVAQAKDGDRDSAIRALRGAVATAPADSVQAVRAGFLLGAWLNESHRASEAAPVLQHVMTSTAVGPLAPFVASEYARALAATGDSAGADAAWDRLLADPTAPSSLRAQVLQKRIDAARESGDRVAQARWLDKQISTTGESSAMLERSELARIAGDQATARALLLQIVARQPGSREAVTAVATLGRAGVAIDAGQKGLVYYRHGAYADARAVLLPSLDEAGVSKSGLVFRLFYLAASFEDDGLLEEAVGYYDRAAALGADSPYTHRAKYWAARVTETRGQERDAAARYARLVKEGPPGEFTEEAAFRSGYMLLATGDAAAAVETWEASGPSPNARVAYWKSRAYALEGLRFEAQGELAHAVELDPWSFYGQQAARELGRLPALDVGYHPRKLAVTIDWPAIEGWLALRLPGNLPGSPPTAAAEFMAVGMREAAKDVLLDGARDAGAWRLLELAEEAHRAGLVDVAAQLATRLVDVLHTPAIEVPADLVRVQYPLDYVEHLDSEARTRGIDPLFLAALVRQESYWDASAGSSAGALGLTQVIPPTGEAIAHALGVADFRAEDLFRPEVSLRFGAYYIGAQLKDLGNAYYALSAYNAGPINAARWREAVGAGGPAEFVETIDYSETQHYVAVIMDHYAHYLRVYSD